MRSPYNLLQEIYHPNEWKIMVCCMFLNQTTRLQVDRVRHEFFKRWPTPKKASKAEPAEMSELIKQLGLSNRRSASIIRMSREFIEKDWTDPKELHGLGQYAQDSYDIFIRKQHVDDPADKFLNKYMVWLKSKDTK